MNIAADGDLAAIKRIAVLAPAPDEAIAALIRRSARVDFAADAVIVHQAETDSAAFIVLSGEITIVDDSPHGRSFLARIPAPTLVGEIGALAHLPRTATVLAGTDVRALRVERDVLVDFCRETPEILVSVVGRLGQQIQSTNRALGLYAGSFAALEREDFDPAIIEELNNPTPELRDFSAAFQRLAHHIALERKKRSEMASAALIQKAMLPQTLDGLDPKARVDVFGAMKSARDVGGDFYDVFLLGENRLALLIGDVCGKGVPASLFMSITMTILRLAARQDRDITSTLADANRMLFAQNASGLFATLFYGILDLETGMLDYASSGHNPPFLLRGDGACLRLMGGGTPMGILPEKTIKPHALRLERGDALFLFTDGVTEAEDPDGAEYGDARLGDVLSRTAGAKADDICRIVTDDVAKFAGSADQFDDITCVAAVFGGN
jgi:phosphoserine phosphatase RsbU/P